MMGTDSLDDDPQAEYLRSHPGVLPGSGGEFSPLPQEAILDRTRYRHWHTGFTEIGQQRYQRQHMISIFLIFF
ncbi:hypothetical protein GS597_13220 [Synechococcales cyanobacterium C]|uniref:Uncharacterized protein n=1 Tax=Petrachloros mirabilis ULC683 TaxID=2781853 RepID=A0A8K2A0Q6_9CYAN|nr:hypothetical protein [Petrachloros mirabilis]NCJ07451.1 hypothetical protein [Petrachloros mirabilis ULC683]